MQLCMFLCLPLTLQEEPTESRAGCDQAFLYVPLLSPYGNNKNRVAAPMIDKSDAFYFMFFCSFLILPFYDEHTWSAEGTLETGCGCGSRVSTSGHCSATNIVCMSIYFSSKHSIKKKQKNHRVNGEFSSLQSGSPVKQDTKNIAGRCYLLKLFTKILEQNGRLGMGPVSANIHLCL